ncbi:MAG TPA: DUF3786 domain-containing protein [Thermodesulfovibrionales bacterium]|nr:DUF3786 domain-containing protein [Thermodesulfovibrionales bacterium]
MNPLEIYKLLPKTNCGECPSKTCMSLAVQVKVSPDSLGECGHINPENRSRIEAMVVKGDWREELVKSLAQEASALRFEEIADSLGGHMDGGSLTVRCIGVDYTITPGGTISPDRGNAWIKILLLHYIRSGGKGGFTGKWISFSEFKGGLVKASSFAREAEELLRELFDEDPAAIVGMMRRLGGTAVNGYEEAQAWSIDLLPKVRTLVLYRPGDAEFPSSSLNILFDALTGNFLDVESIVFLCEGLTHTLRRMAKDPP